MPRRHEDPRKLPVDERIRRGARYVVGFALMDDRDPHTLFDEDNIKDTVTSIAELAYISGELSPELTRQVVRIASDELGPVFEDLQRIGAV